MACRKSCKIHLAFIKFRKKSSTYFPFKGRSCRPAFTFFVDSEKSIWGSHLQNSIFPLGFPHQTRKNIIPFILYFMSEGFWLLASPSIKSTGKRRGIDRLTFRNKAFLWFFPIGGKCRLLTSSLGWNKNMATLKNQEQDVKPCLFIHLVFVPGEGKNSPKMGEQLGPPSQWKNRTWEREIYLQRNEWPHL